MGIIDHDLEPVDGVRVCKNCGLAIHKNGAYWLKGTKLDISEGKPLCHTSNIKNPLVTYQ